MPQHSTPPNGGQTLDPITGLPLNLSTAPVTSGIEEQNPTIDPLTGKPLVPVRSRAKQGDVPAYEEQKGLGVDDIRENDPSDEQKRAMYQGGWEQAGQAVKQFAGGFAGGFLQSVGATGERFEIGNLIGGAEKEYTNALMDVGRDIIEASHGNIYEYDPGKVNFSDSAWWYNRFADQGITFGIAAESLVETGLVSFLTGGSGTGAAIAGAGSKFTKLRGMANAFSAGNKFQKAKAVMTASGMKAKKALNILNTGTKAEQFRKKATAWAGIRRYNESVIEAYEAADERYGHYTEELGMSHEEAIKHCSKAASITINANIPLLDLDLMQIRMMTFNPASGMTGDLITKGLTSVVKNTAAARGVALLGTGIVEGG